MRYLLITFVIFNINNILSENIEIKNKISNKLCVDKKFLFNYKDEDISIVVNKLAALKNLNVLFPQDEKFSVKFNYSNKNELTIEQSWNIILTALEIAGYSGVHKGNIYEIVNNTNILKEPLQIFIDTNVDDLPNSVQKIRYLYNFENLSLKNSSTLNNLNQILKDMLSAPPLGNYLLDATTNSLLITNRSADVKSAMKIISELDKTGIREVIEVIPLLHTKSDYISKIINQLVASKDQQKFGFQPKPINTNLYFSESTKIIAIDRLNAIAILGPNDSVKRVKNLIVKYLDKPLDSPKSLIHIRHLDYIDSNNIAPVLQSLVKAKLPNAQAQVKDELANAIIIAEQQVAIDALKPTESGDPTATTGNESTPADTSNTAIMKGKLTTSSNSLIVAAKESDWLEIKKLIDQLDTQQPQVAVDVLIAELDLNFVKNLGAQTRNINNQGNAQNFNYQTANLAPPIVNTNPDGSLDVIKGLAADLLQPLANTTPITNLATMSPLGSFMASFKDLNGVAYYLRGLDKKQSSEIIFRGNAVIKNNVTGNISLTIEEYFAAEGQAQLAGSFRIVKAPVSATTSIDVTPTISALKTISMNIVIKANVFDAVVPGQVNKRELTVKANLNDNEVLVIGGIMTYNHSITDLQTPLLSQIPILGSLFRNRAYLQETNPIYIFILPTIIQPRIGGGRNAYTQSKIDMLRKNLDISEECLLGSNFANLKDPITKFFLPTEYKEFNQKVDEFIGDKKTSNPKNEFNQKIDKIKENLESYEKIAS